MSATFTLPKEFEQFVTSREDLLKQFDGNTSTCETVAVSIHWRGTQTIESAVTYLEGISSIIAEKSTNYKWHNEPLQLSICFDYKGIPSLLGAANIGECIDDEWFIVYLLLHASKQIPELAISVTDNDGQFLLMEAADFIPDWLDPENAENRVWIRNGRIHIIPLDEPGKLKTGGIKLDSAFACIFNSSEVVRRRTDAGEQFNCAIFAKTVDVFPAKIAAYQHTTMCLLPAWLDHLLKRHPEVLAKAVGAFCVADKDALRLACTAQDSKKSTTASTTTGTTAPATAVPLFPSIPNPNREPWVAVRVHFTRALYAQMTFKNFHPPRMYHEVMRRMTAARSRKVSHAFDLGCRLACGVQCALFASQQQFSAPQRAKGSGSKSTSGGADEAVWAEVVRVAQNSGYVSGNSAAVDAQRLAHLRELFDRKQLMSEANYQQHRSGDPLFPEGFHVFLARVLAELSTSQTMRGSAAVVDEEGQEQYDQSLFQAVLAGLAACDDDAWLYMTPDELDRELQARMDRHSGRSEGSSGSDGVKVSSVESQPMPTGMENLGSTGETDKANDEAAQLQRMLDGLKGFMAGSSDLDGVIPESTKTRSAHKSREGSNPVGPYASTPAPPTAAAASKEGSSTGDTAATVPSPAAGELQLDFDLLQSMIAAASSGAPPPSGAANSASGWVDGSSGAASVHVEGNGPAMQMSGDDLGLYFSAQDLAEGEREGDGDHASESDRDNESEDDSDDEQGAQAADAYLQRVMSSAASPRTTASEVGADQKQGKPHAQSSALLGVGGGVLSTSAGGSGRATARSKAADLIDSDDEVDAEGVRGGSRAAPAGGRSDNGADSDDEEAGEGEDNEEDDEDLEALFDSLDADTIREYQKMMDAELFGQSSLAETFEWKQRRASGDGNDDDDEVDVDMSVLKNLMEAQAQGMGAPMAGPLGQLMAQLGISMPLPPPMKSGPV